MAAGYSCPLSSRFTPNLRRGPVRRRYNNLGSGTQEPSSLGWRRGCGGCARRGFCRRRFAHSLQGRRRGARGRGAGCRRPAPCEPQREPGGSSPGDLDGDGPLPGRTHPLRLRRQGSASSQPLVAALLGHQRAEHDRPHHRSHDSIRRGDRSCGAGVPDALQSVQRVGSRCQRRREPARGQHPEPYAATGDRAPHGRPLRQRRNGREPRG